MYKSIICAAFISASFNAISATQPIKLPYIPQSATVDGKLDEPSWKQARKIVIDNVTWPYENTKSPVNTNVYVYEMVKLFLSDLMHKIQTLKIFAHFIVIVMLLGTMT